MPLLPAQELVDFLSMTDFPKTIETEVGRVQKFSDPFRKMRLDELVSQISAMLKTAAPEASYERIKGRQCFGLLRKFAG